MSDPEDFATFRPREAGQTRAGVGQVVKGRVIQISAESVSVDVGGKVRRGSSARRAGHNEAGPRGPSATRSSDGGATGDEIRSRTSSARRAARQALAVAAQTGIPVEAKWRP